MTLGELSAFVRTCARAGRPLRLSAAAAGARAAPVAADEAAVAAVAAGLFRRGDADGDGGITLAEFAAGVGPLLYRDLWGAAGPAAGGALAGSDGDFRKLLAARRDAARRRRPPPRPPRSPPPALPCSAQIIRCGLSWSVAGGDFDSDIDSALPREAGMRPRDGGNQNFVNRRREKAYAEPIREKA